MVFGSTEGAIQADGIIAREERGGILTTKFSFLEHYDVTAESFC